MSGGNEELLTCMSLLTPWRDYSLPWNISQHPPRGRKEKVYFYSAETSLGSDIPKSLRQNPLPLVAKAVCYLNVSSVQKAQAVQRYKTYL